MSSNVTVLGGGNTAFALAADLALAGHLVRLAELPAMHETVEPIQGSRTIALNGVGHTGEARLADVTTDIAAAVDGADLILLAVPAYAHRPFAEACARHLEGRPGNRAGAGHARLAGVRPGIRRDGQS